MSKSKLIYSVALLGVLVGGLAAFTTAYLMPDFNIVWLIAIFAFFVLAETLLVSMAYTKSRTATSKQMVNVYMLSKVLKIVLSLVFVLIYFVIERTFQFKNFAIVFIIFYLLFLFIETFFFTRIEKQLKLNKSDEA